MAFLALVIVIIATSGPRETGRTSASSSVHNPKPKITPALQKTNPHSGQSHAHSALKHYQQETEPVVLFLNTGYAQFAGEWTQMNSDLDKASVNVSQKLAEMRSALGTAESMKNQLLGNVPSSKFQGVPGDLTNGVSYQLNSSVSDYTTAYVDFVAALQRGIKFQSTSNSLDLLAYKNGMTQGFKSARTAQGELQTAESDLNLNQ